MKKFGSNGLHWIRWEIVPDRGIVAFFVSGVTASLVSNRDFDQESDEVIEEIKNQLDRDTHSKGCFEYEEHLGFVEVDHEKQNWFKFVR